MQRKGSVPKDVNCFDNGDQEEEKMQSRNEQQPFAQKTKTLRLKTTDMNMQAPVKIRGDSNNPVKDKLDRIRRQKEELANRRKDTYQSMERIRT